jgi:uncharacterized protein (DUF2062 family)
MAAIVLGALPYTLLRGPVHQFTSRRRWRRAHRQTDVRAR